MPLIRTLYQPAQTVTGIWQITEPAESLLELLDLNNEEYRRYQQFSHEQRKKQWLAYHCILKQLLFPHSPELVYDEHGKPHLKNSPTMISVSHAGEYSAAIISKTLEVGIDIEQMKTRIERVTSRYLSQPEQEHLGPHPSIELLYVYWGAKEALYKLYGNPDLDFKNDIRIHPFNYLCNTSQTCTATLTPGNTSRDCHLQYLKFDDYMMVMATAGSEAAK